VITLQNAQAIIDLNIAVQDRDKSIAAKDARYVCVSASEMFSYSWHLQPLLFAGLAVTLASDPCRIAVESSIDVNRTKRETSNTANS